MADARRSAREPGARRETHTRRVFEVCIEALSACGEDALSQALCPGIVDPNEAVRWVDRADRLLRFGSERSALRSEVPAVAEALEALVQQVELPLGISASKVALQFVERLPAVRVLLAQDVEAAYEGDLREPAAARSSDRESRSAARCPR